MLVIIVTTSIFGMYERMLYVSKYHGNLRFSMKINMYGEWIQLSEINLERADILCNISR